MPSDFRSRNVRRAAVLGEGEKPTRPNIPSRDGGRFFFGARQHLLSSIELLSLPYSFQKQKGNRPRRALIAFSVHGSLWYGSADARTLLVFPFVQRLTHRIRTGTVGRFGYPLGGCVSKT